MRLTFADRSTAEHAEARLRTHGDAPKLTEEQPGTFAKLFGGKSRFHLDFDDAHAPALLDDETLGLDALTLCGPGAKERLDDALEAESRRLYERRGGYLDLHDVHDQSLMLEEETLFRALVGTPAKDQVDLLRAYVSGRKTLVTRVQPETAEPPDVEVMLRNPLLLRAGFLTTERLERVRAALPPEGRDTVFVTMPTAIEGLLLVPVIDAGTQLLSVVGDTLEELGLTPEGALSTGLQAVAQLPVPNGILMQVTPDIAFGVLQSDDGFAAIRVLFDGVRDGMEAALGGPAVYAIPHRDVLYAARADMPAARIALWAHAKGEHAAAEHPLLPVLVRVGENGLQALAAEELLAGA